MTKPSVGPTGGAYTVPFGTVAETRALACARVRDFVVIGGTPSFGGTTDHFYTIRWCAIGDPSDFPQPNTDDARSKQAGEQTFPSRFGFVTAIAGNDFFGYVFQENAISKMTYIGGDTVFAFDTFEEGRGCESQGGIVQVDDKVFFRSDRGYHMLENDQITDIGYGLVDDSF